MKYYVVMYNVCLYNLIHVYDSSNRYMHAMMLFYNSIISNDIWLVGHGVGLRDGADDFAWAARRERHGRYVACDDGSRADDATVADRDARADDDIRPEPAVVADFDWFRVAEMGGIAVFVQHGAAFVRQHGMDGRDNRAVRAEIVVVADFNRCVVLYREIVVEEIPLADFRVDSIVEENRALHERAFADFA